MNSSEELTPDPDPSEFLHRLSTILILIGLVGPPWVNENGDGKPQPQDQHRE